MSEEDQEEHPSIKLTFDPMGTKVEFVKGALISPRKIERATHVMLRELRRERMQAVQANRQAQRLAAAIAVGEDQAANVESIPVPIEEIEETSLESALALLEKVRSQTDSEEIEVNLT